MSFFRSFLRIGVSDYTLALPLIYALKILSRADRPIHRTGGDPQLLLDIVQKLKGIVGISVQLIDKGKDRYMTHHTYLKELSCLRLHALGGVDHHHRRIRRHQCPVRIL